MALTVCWHQMTGRPHDSICMTCRLVWNHEVMNVWCISLLFCWAHWWLKTLDLTYSLKCSSTFLMVSACVPRVESTLLLDFIDVLRFYICFWAQGKFCFTPHLISHLVCCFLRAARSTLPWFKFHFACHSLFLSVFAFLSLSICLPMHAFRQCSCCHHRLVFNIIRVSYYLTELLFSNSLSPCCHLKESSAPLLIL